MSAATTSGTAKVTLPSDTQILIEREFNAPRHLVYTAWTTPEHVRRWWVGERGEATLVEIDLRVGGRWRYVMTSLENREVAFNGEYREVVENERLVYTEVFEDFPDAHAVNTVTFTETGDGRTTVACLVDHNTQEERDMHVNSGMEGGMQEALDALERIAVSLG
jgi:uncharacterized protein YndB with AHSA1/START domain